MKKAEDCDRLGEASGRITRIMGICLEALRHEFPEIQLAVVVRTKEGLAISNGVKADGGESTLQQIEQSHRLLRDGAESCGRALFRSPGEPTEVALESVGIIAQSKENVARWAASKCQHTRCYVTDAAVAAATAVRILASVGAPEETLRDLTNMVKEACRRTNLKILEQSARGSA